VSEQREEEGIGELLTRLAEDARSFGMAELEYYRTLAEAKLDEVRTSLWMGAAAAGLLLAASVALVVGLVLTLSPLIGPGFATLLVVAVSGGIAWLLGRSAWRHVKRVLGITK
jgi:hypothetical protein